MRLRLQRHHRVQHVSLAGAPLVLGAQLGIRSLELGNSRRRPLLSAQEHLNHGTEPRIALKLLIHQRQHEGLLELPPYLALEHLLRLMVVGRSLERQVERLQRRLDPHEWQAAMIAAPEQPGQGDDLLVAEEHRQSVGERSGLRNRIRHQNLQGVGVN